MTAREDAPMCELCGEPMPEGETMFKFHGYSGPCPKPPLPKKKIAGIAMDAWKLPIFERHLNEAGYAIKNCGALIGDTLLLQVETDDVKALEIVVRAANAEAALEAK